MTERASTDVAQRSGIGVKHWIFLVLLAAGLFAALYWGLGYLVQSLTHESTDDAFLEAHVVSIAPKVSGIVSAVHVTHNQRVKKGDPLFEIDPRDYEAALEQKKAGMASAKANESLVAASYTLMQTRVDTAEASARQAQADAAAAKATAERAEADFKRAEGLIGQQILSPQEFDAAKAAAISAAAAFRSAEEKAATEQSRVKEAAQQLVAAKSAFDQAKAQLNQTGADVKTAELNRSYTHVIAPEDGVIARKNVEPGSYVQVGQQLLALVPDELWVVANFKETQLANIRPGQRTEVEIDSVPDREFPAHVDSIQSGSGARFSLLPPENAVGNFVKVVQRVPVKIVFDRALKAEHTLGPGMSVQPSIQVSDWTLAPIWRGLIAALLALLLTWLTAKVLTNRNKAAT